MKNILFSVVALFLSLALLISGSAMLGTLISLRLSIVGMSSTAIGIILACYSLGFVLGTIYGVNIIRTVGHIRSFAVYAAVACAATLLHPLIDGVIGWALMRLAIGYCLAGLMTVTESWINDRATADTRGKILGIYTVNFYLASSIGQLVVGLNDPLNFVAYSLVAVLIVMSLVPLALTRGLIPTPPAATDALRLRQLLKDAPSGMTGVVVSGLALSAFVALAPLYAASNGLPISTISVYMSFSIACAIALQWPAGWLSDKVGRLPVLTGLLFGGALMASIAAVLGGYSVVILFLFSGAFFAIAASVYPVSVALANDQLPNDQLVAACASLLRTYGLGSMLGPLLGGMLMQLFGAPSLFIFVALAFLAAGAAVHYVFRPRDKVPLAEQGEYVTVNPISTPVLTEIDPRNEEFEQHHPGEPADWDVADKLEMLIPQDETSTRAQDDDNLS